MRAEVLAQKFAFTLTHSSALESSLRCVGFESNVKIVVTCAVDKATK